MARDARTAAQGPLSGITVVDFGHYISGPLLGMLLADQGAEVTRIVRPGSIDDLPDGSAIWNRGKRVVELDLKNGDGLAEARRLVADADVLIENFRPGVMERLGLGAESLRQENPGLVYCCLPGFPASDPRSGQQAWEGVVEAAAGIYIRLDGSPYGPQSPTDEPVFSPIPLASSYAAFLGAVSVVGALVAREAGGTGQAIEVPAFDASLVGVGFQAERWHQPSASLPPESYFVWQGVWECSDGKYVFVHAGSKFILDFVEEIGAAGWSEQPDFRARAEALFLQRPAAAWEEIGDRTGAEVVECRTWRDWMSNQDAWASGLVEPPRSTGAAPEPAVQVRVTPPGGTADAGPAAAQPGETALSGLRVLDLTALIAGPTCGRTLAEFGAEVIKVDGPERSPVPQVASKLHSFHLDVNRGKRSIYLDLKKPGAVDVFLEMVRDADVMIENFRPGVAEALGVGFDAVRAVNPDIVYASLPMYSLEGPWSHRPGHDYVAQAGTGMSQRFGGPDGRPIMQNVRGLNDYGTGLMGAFATMLGLFQRRRTGSGARVSTSLAATATILQSMFSQDPAEAGRYAGHGLKGFGPLQRIYRAQDGWVFVGIDSRRPEAALSALGVGSDGGPAGLEHRLEASIGALTVEDAVARIAGAGAGAHRIVGIDDVIQDRHIRARGTIVTLEHDGIGAVDQIGVVPKLSRTPVVLGRAATAPGAFTREILTEHGIAPERIESLIESGAAEALSPVITSQLH